MSSTHETDMKKEAGLGSARTAGVAIAAALHLAVLPGSLEGQLRSVTQIVYGMDCAPCAHAVENRLSALDGAGSVKLSLNEGTAVIDFRADDHRTTLERIRRSIRESGFVPKEARVRLAGTLERSPESLILRTPGDETFVLEAPAGARDALRDLEPGAGSGDTVITGTVDPEADSDGRWILRVEKASG